MELAITVMIIAILLALAIPTLLGARTRANDRAAQATIRVTHGNQMVYFSDASVFTEDTVVLDDLDGSISYTNDRTTMASASSNTVFVELESADVVILGAHSRTGTCWWMRLNGKGPHGFAQNQCAAVPTAFNSEW